MKVFLEHITDSIKISYTGYQEAIVPRRNLGTIYIKGSEENPIVISSDNVLVIEPKSFEPFKFTYEFIQEPRIYMEGIDESVYEVDGDSELIGATIIEEMETKWDKFFLVVRYIDEDGVQNSKILVE